MVEDAALILRAIDYAMDSHSDFSAEQRQGFIDTFDLDEGEDHSRRAAAAIAAFFRLQPRN